MRDWYVDSFRELREFPEIRDGDAEQQFTSLLRGIYSRHRNVVPVMAMGVAQLKRELSHGAARPPPPRYLSVRARALAPPWPSRQACRGQHPLGCFRGGCERRLARPPRAPTFWATQGALTGGGGARRHWPQ